MRVSFNCMCWLNKDLAKFILETLGYTFARKLSNGISAAHLFGPIYITAEVNSNIRILFYVKINTTDTMILVMTMITTLLKYK